MRSAVEVDRLSFEFDKQRKQRRADAKARTLLAHINRVDEYSRRQQQLAENHDNLRLAVKAAHRQEHFERAFDEVRSERVAVVSSVWMATSTWRVADSFVVRVAGEPRTAHHAQAGQGRAALRVLAQASERQPGLHVQRRPGTTNPLERYHTNKFTSNMRLCSFRVPTHELVENGAISRSTWLSSAPHALHLPQALLAANKNTNSLSVAHGDSSSERRAPSLLSVSAVRKRNRIHTPLLLASPLDRNALTSL
jgi:hypothetical protein